MKSKLLPLALGIAAALAGGTAFAQAFPAKPIRFIVAYPPGGSVDLHARHVGAKMAENLGQPIVVENRPGGNTHIGAEVVAKAPPDGYTLFHTLDSTMTLNQALYSKLPFDPIRDFAPVARLASGNSIIVVHPSVPVKTMRELVDYAKANPGKLNFGSGGPGATPHLAGEMFKMMAGIRVTHVPYKGGAPALANLVGGQIQFMLENIPGTLPFVKGGKLRALAVTDIKRSPLLPDLPTLDEAGLKGYELVGWNGMFVPAGTPNAIVNKLHEGVVAALAIPDVKERLTVLGADGVGDTPQHFSAFIKADIAKWAKVVKAAGIKVE